jgi:uncharacterized protein (DUF362 family)
MLSRREFLQRSVLYALALASGNALASCAPNPTTTPAPPTSTLAPTSIPPTAVATRAVSSSIASSTSSTVSQVVPTVAPTALPTATMTATPVSPTAFDPYLVVSRGARPGAITRAAIDALGGMTRFVKKGNDVILKPNICNAAYGPEYATTTNPEVLAELVKMCLEAGASRVRVMDQGFHGTAVEAYKISGIREAVEKVGGVMEIMADMKYANVNFPKARDLKTWKVFQDILKADVVINVPIAKTHDLAQVTLAMKGLMGVITDRPNFHSALDQRIADLGTVVKPTLNVIDAVRTLAVNGPTGGSLDFVVQTNTIIASHDPVAADGYAAQLLFLIKPADIGYIKFGAEMGLGTYDFSMMKIKEVNS